APSGALFQIEAEKGAAVNPSFRHAAASCSIKGRSNARRRMAAMNKESPPPRGKRAAQNARRITPGSYLWSGRREAGDLLLAAFGVLPDQLHGLADLQAVEVAVDDVGHHRRAFVERDVGDAIRLGRTAHDAVGVDLAVAGSLHRGGVVAEGERREGARIPVGLTGVVALAD